MSRIACLLVIVPLSLFAALPAAPVPKARPTPRDQVPNTNALLKQYRDRLTFSRSSEWQGWPAEKAFDGNPDTSWFSASGDSPATGKVVWVAATFPVDVAVSRVTVLGNRDPGSLIGYSVLVGKLELLDAGGRVVVRVERESKGEKHDFDFVLAEPFGRVRTVRFTAIKDETTEGKSQTRCVGVGEILVE